MVLVYQAYGREDILQQSLFSITSWLCVRKADSPLRVWVYTDRPDYFKKYFGVLVEGHDPLVRVVAVSAAQIQRWRGAIDFVHRVKIEILQEAAKECRGPLFYVDGDTFFRVDPTALFSQVGSEVSLMHVAEAVVEEGRDPLSKKVTKFLKKNSFQVGGRDEHVSPRTTMWNAGAIGLHPQHFGLLQDILELTDEMYARYPKHIQEQLAVSHFLQTRTRIIPADAEIGHYWNQKDEYQAAIQKFLAKYPTYAEAQSGYAQFAWPSSPVAPLPKPRRRFWDFLKI